MKIKIVTEISSNKENAELIDVSIRRVGGVPQKYGAIAAAAHLAITQSMNDLFKRMVKGGADGETDNK